MFLLDNLKNTADIVTPVVANGATHVYHLYVVRSKKRDALQGYLAEKGIGTLIHYPIPPHRQKALAGIESDKHFPIADEIHNTTLSLPCSFCHTEDEIIEVIDALNNF